MATIITTECISCGACEPECPNNAISQGETIFIIDPKLCTECVGFHDYEACAAVCPVDCCVTDPTNVESEEVLIARARALHPDTQFSDNFESRFRKGQAKPAGGVTKSAASAQENSAAHPQAASAAPAVTAARSAAATTAESITPEIKFVPLPEIDSWQIPVRCYKCQQSHIESVRNFMVGNVIFCPHCNKSMVVRDNVNFHLRGLLRDFYDKWDKEQSEFKNRREKELAAFVENRAKEAQVFERRQQAELEKLGQQLQALGEAYDTPGKPFKKGSRFAWG
jgi:hypothetical protein